MSGVSLNLNPGATGRCGGLRKLLSGMLPARTARTLLVLGGLAAAMVVAAVVSLSIGALKIPLAAVTGILLERVGIATGAEFDSVQTSVLMNIRFPRVLLALLVGGGLGLCGGVIQGLFRNPLAEPGLIGISAGAAMAVVITIVAAPLLLPPVAWARALSIPVAAFGGGLAATVLVMRLSTIQGRTVVPTMLLAGIAINALAGAVTGLMLFVADDSQLRDITFWSLGSLGAAAWGSLLVGGPVMVAAMIPLALHARSLNALALGEAEAHHLGVAVERVKTRLVILVAMVVGVAVSLTGIIGFVGLVIPHVIRLAFGPDHRLLLPASALLGGGMLVLADLFSRTVAAPAELPIGIVTALLGAPFFLALLIRDRGRGMFG